MIKIEVQHYTKVIKKRKILDDVSLTLEGGYIYGFRGINGSGKTMLMRAVSGMIMPTKGSVRVDGMTVRATKTYPTSLGVLIENPMFLPGCTGFDNLRLLAGLSGQADDMEIKRVMSELDLNPDDKRLYREYSLGMRQKLGIVAAIMGGPRLIILDEPINALDEKSVKKVKELLVNLKNENRVIIIACHDREEMDYLADRIFLIEDGRLKSETALRTTPN